METKKIIIETKRYSITETLQLFEVCTPQFCYENHTFCLGLIILRKSTFGALYNPSSDS